MSWPSVYSTGTISIGVGATSVVGAGTFWSPLAAQANLLIVADRIAFVDAVVDDTHLTIPAWAGPLVSGATYRLVQFPQSSLQATKQIRDFLAATAGLGVIWAVTGAAPDPGLGDDGQYALKTNDGRWKMWLKVSGVWELQTSLLGFTPRGDWDSATAYEPNDTVQRLGVAYVSFTANTNHPPESNPADWTALGGALTSIDLTQASSGTSAVAGPVNYDLLTITNEIGSTTPGQSDGTNNSNVVGLRINYITGGTHLQGSQQGAIFAHLHNTIANASGGDKTAVVGLGYSNVVDSGGGILAGAALNAVVDNGGSHAFVEGSEHDVGINTGGSAGKRAGLGIWNTGDVQANPTGMDAAIYVTSTSVAGAFKALFQLSNHAGQMPLDVTADFFKADAAQTVANIFNLPNVTVTGSIASFPNLFIGGDGKANFGASGAPSSGAIVKATAPSAGYAELWALANGTNGFDGFQAGNSLGTNLLTLYANEPLRSVSVFGQTVGNWVSLVAAGAANNGLLIGTGAAKPVILGTNSVESMRLGANGFVGVSSTAGNLDPDAPFTINANDGATVAPPVGTTFHMVASVGLPVRTTYDSFANSTQIFARRADGSRASPSAVQAGDQIAALLGQGYGASGYIATGSNGGFGIYAKQNFTDAHAGTYLSLLTTPNDSTTIAERARIGDGFMVGTITDPGAGAIANANAVITAAGTANFGSNSAPPGSAIVNATAPFSGDVQLIASQNIANGINGVFVTTSLGTNSLTLYANEPSRSLSVFGQVIGNWASLVTSGADSNGILLGTGTAKPIILGTNSAENMRIASGGNVGISSTAGNVSPDALLTVNANTGATVAPPTGTNVHIVGAAASLVRATYDAFANSSQIFGRRADGTRASPSAVQADELITALFGQGYGATGYIASGANGGLGVYAKQNFTDAAAGTYLSLFSTPNGSTTLTERARVGDGLMVGTTTDPGAGLINVNTGFRIGNAAVAGNYLRGDGTNFISAALSAADLVGTTTNSDPGVGKIGEYFAANGGNIGVGDNTVTITIASPAVITHTNNPYSGKGNWTAAVYYDNSGGALPTGITANTTYWVIGSSVSGNTYQIATSIANALAGIAINTSGSQSGVHSGRVGVASLTTATATDVAAILLPAGDYDVGGVVAVLPAGSTVITAVGAGVSSVSNTLPSRPDFSLFQGLNGTGVLEIINAPLRRITLASPATIYMEAYDAHTTSTARAAGAMRARRMS